MNGSDTVTCVDASGCGDGYYADPEELQCATCGIESCQACTPKDNNLVCTRCSPDLSQSTASRAHSHARS
ncbi:Molecular chaperone, DnaJ family protein [Giardia duodenalis]|uniref:Molecular chaperone, DnaJ family protein n=1 Tax=Giardia intestinalis TaxID=5741 RepID=V6T7W6_GIAIN|nr:Molecular chaperone, DnaJ family protein [Giardia intestinalis]